MRLVAGSYSFLRIDSMSDAMRMVVTGVRSSWLTSETKLRCMSPAFSSSSIFCTREFAISLNERCSTPISSCLSTCTRMSRLPDAMVSAAAATFCTGSTAERMTRNMMTPISPLSSMLAMAMLSWICINDCCWAW